MNETHAAALLRSMSGLASRRGIVGGLASGLLATSSFGLVGDETKAKMSGKRNKKRKNKNRNRNRNKNKRNNAKTRLDATCPGAGAEGVAHFAGDMRLAQTFTAIRSGPLVKATLPVRSEADTETALVLRLSPVDGSGLPSDEVLAESTTRIDAPPDVPALDFELEFAFADPFSVEAGVDYALILTRPDGDFEFIWRGDVGNPCGGAVSFSEDQTGSFQLLGGTVDLIFTTFVRS